MLMSHQPKKYRASQSKNPHDEWEQSLLIAPDQVVERCGEPSWIWMTGSRKRDSEYTIDQTHLLYSDKEADVLISRYPNAKNMKVRNWFYSGILIPEALRGWSVTISKDNSLPCVGDGRGVGLCGRYG